MKVTVYTLPSDRCVACRFTKRDLDNGGIEYSSVRLDQDEAARKMIAAQGVASAPYVEVDLGDGASWSWFGYRPSQIEKLKVVHGDMLVA